MRSTKMFSKESRDGIALALYQAGYSKRKVAIMCNLGTVYIQELVKDFKGVRYNAAKFDMNDKFIVKTLKETVFLDVETSPVSVHSFSVGRGSMVSYGNLHNQQSIKFLSVCAISMYDVLTKGINSMTSLECSLNENGVDDGALVKALAIYLADKETLIAHNANFDNDWITSRMVSTGIKFYRPKLIVDTMSLFRKTRLLCKKLDYLMSHFFGINKLPTNMYDWAHVVESTYMMTERVRALDYMSEYNRMDVALMIPLYLGFARLNAFTAVNFNNPNNYVAQCNVDGTKLHYTGTWMNRTTGLTYKTFINKKLGCAYRTRLNINSKKVNQNRLIQHRTEIRG